VLAFVRGLCHLNPTSKRSVRQQRCELPLSFKAFWLIGVVIILSDLTMQNLFSDSSSLAGWGPTLIQSGTLVVFLGSALETRRVGRPCQIVALMAVALTLLTVCLILRDTSFRKSQPLRVDHSSPLLPYSTSFNSSRLRSCSSESRIGRKPSRRHLWAATSWAASTGSHCSGTAACNLSRALASRLRSQDLTPDPAYPCQSEVRADLSDCRGVQQNPHPIGHPSPAAATTRRLGPGR
jgi:hypothetical protein